MHQDQVRLAQIRRGRRLTHLAMLLFAALIAGSFSFGGLAARAIDGVEEPVPELAAGGRTGAGTVDTAWPESSSLQPRARLGSLV